MKKDKKSPQIQIKIANKNDHSQNPKFDVKGGILRSILEVQSKKREDTATKMENSSGHVEQRCSENKLCDNNYLLATPSLVDQDKHNISNISSNFVVLFIFIFRAMLSIIIILLFGFNLLTIDNTEFTPNNYSSGINEASLEKLY